MKGSNSLFSDIKHKGVLPSYIAKNRIYPHKLPLGKQKPNSTIVQKDENGRVVRIRHYDENGNAVKDIDYTDHGRPDIHKVPHTHEINVNDIIIRKKGVLPYERSSF